MKVIKADIKLVRLLQVCLLENIIHKDMEAKFLYICPIMDKRLHERPMIWQAKWPKKGGRND